MSKTLRIAERGTSYDSISYRITLWPCEMCI